MNHFDMNPEKLDPRVRAADRSARRRARRDMFDGFFVFVFVSSLIFYGLLAFVIIHFLAKIW